MKNSTDFYRENYTAFDHCSVFSTPWWWDAVCGADNWDVACHKKGEEVQAMFPYLLRKKSGFKAIGNPLMTPYQSFLIRYPEGQKTATRLSYEKEQISALLEALPKADQFNFRFHPLHDNLLPVHWKGFELLTRYTLVLDDLSDPDTLFKGFSESTRRQIKKASKSLSIKTGTDIAPLYEFKKASQELTGELLNYADELYAYIWKACTDHNSGEVIYALNDEGKEVAGIFYVWDAQSAYYLIGSSLPEYRNSGAMSFLMWEAIQRSAQKTKMFNFEGSMIPEVERFFRGFGAQPITYIEARKYNSKILKQRDKLLGRI